MKNQLNSVQQAAVQRLISAKSDREIARLLRQYHRLLNLHQRPRSNILHREPWANYELGLLGRTRDEELARWLRRSPAAIAAKRESLRFPIFSPQRIFWSKREIELLGKRPDPVVARMLGRTRYAVQLKRHSLKIPQCWEDRRGWTPAEDGLLGKTRDQELAKKLGRTVSSVRLTVSSEPASVSSKHRNDGQRRSCVCWAGSRMWKSPAGPGAFWPPSETSGFNSAFPGVSHSEWLNLTDLPGQSESARRWYTLKIKYTDAGRSEMF
jgi:hypothetical protein